MATGDIKWFAQALNDLGLQVHNLSSSTLKLGLVNNSTVPTVSTANPCWGAGGSTNFATNQVAYSTTGYANGGPTLTKTWTNVSSTTPTLRASTVTIAQNAADGFSTAYWGIIYNDSETNKKAIAYIELGGPRANTGGSLTIDWYGANDDILTITQS